jgi:hypothetical protein
MIRDNSFMNDFMRKLDPEIDEKVEGELTSQKGMDVMAEEGFLAAIFKQDIAGGKINLNEGYNDLNNEKQKPQMGLA